MERGNHYNAKQDRFGNWELLNCRDETIAYLQGDDAAQFTEEVTAVARLFDDERPTVYESIEEALDVIIGAYDIA